eukprot:3746771-Amphidinium_carterae.1
MGLSATAAYKVRRRFIRAVVKLPKRVDASAWALIDAGLDGLDPVQHITGAQVMESQEQMAYSEWAMRGVAGHLYQLGGQYAGNEALNR